MTSKHIILTEAHNNNPSMTNQRKSLVSIIVPCFNAEQTLSKCLDSLLAQDDPIPHIICVNDGSTDNTLEILNKYHKKYPYTISVIDQVNSGAWQARITGLKAADSEFIMFLDSDDCAKPDFVKTMLEEIRSSKSDIVICGFERIDEKSGRVLSREFCTPLDPLKLPEDYGALLEVNPAPWNKIFKSEVLTNLPCLQTKPVMLDDLCLLLLGIAHPVSKISFLPSSLVEYRVHPDSTINSADIEQVYDAAIALKEVRTRFSNLGLHALEALDSVAFCHLYISMSFRLIEMRSAISNELLSIVDKDFPLWRTSEYLTFKYAFFHGKAHIRAATASRLAKSGIFNPALNVYSMIKKVRKKDISW